MSEAIEPHGPREALGEWLRVTARGAGAFEAALEDHFGEAQPGDLLARCGLAALAARPGLRLAALRADWLSPAPPRAPIALRLAARRGEAERLDLEAAGEVAHARVAAVLGARAGGPSLRETRATRELPAPEALPEPAASARAEGWPEAYAAGPVDFRRVGPLRPSRARGESCEHATWLRLRAPLPPDPALAQAALVYLAAFYAHWEFERALGERFDHAAFLPLAHGVWLHGEADPGGWLLLRARLQGAAAGCALGLRELIARDGALLATATCEARVARA